MMIWIDYLFWRINHLWYISMNRLMVMSTSNTQICLSLHDSNFLSEASVYKFLLFCRSQLSQALKESIGK